MKAKGYLILSCFAWIISVFAEEPAEPLTFEVMVVADRVNLRNAGNLESDVIGQVNFGDMLTGLELTEEWVRVRAPDTLGVWVHGGLLFEDREVRSRVLNMRSGPGTQFDVLGQLERLDPVTVLERYDEWRRIRATDAVQVWIFRELVRFDEDLVVEEQEPGEAEEGIPPPPEAGQEPEAVIPDEDMSGLPAEVPAEEQTDPATGAEGLELEEETAESPLPLADVEPAPEEIAVVEAVAVEGNERVDSPEDVSLIPLQGQGTASVRRGWVKVYLIAGTAPSRFQLVYRERGREEALAYLHGDEDEIRALSGQPVLVRGRDFWVTGARIPLMRIESIEKDRESGR